MDEIRQAIDCGRDDAARRRDRRAVGAGRLGPPSGPTVARGAGRAGQRGQEQPDQRPGRLWPVDRSPLARHHPRRRHRHHGHRRLAGGIVRHGRTPQRRRRGRARRHPTGPRAAGPSRSGDPRLRSQRGVVGGRPGPLRPVVRRTAGPQQVRSPAGAGRSAGRAVYQCVAGRRRRRSVGRGCAAAGARSAATRCGRSVYGRADRGDWPFIDTQKSKVRVSSRRTAARGKTIADVPSAANKTSGQPPTPRRFSISQRPVAAGAFCKIGA